MFGPPPSSARTYDFMAEVSPRPLKVEKYAEGTIATTSGSATVTGTSTEFSDAHVGCVIRISDNGISEPTSLVGGIDPEPDGSDRPYQYQHIIKSVESTTSLTLESTVAGTLSGVKFVISDPLDIEPGAMFTYFQRLCEFEFAHLIRDEGQMALYALVKDALIQAMGADGRNKGMTSDGRRGYYSDLGDWAIIS